MPKLAAALSAEPTRRYTPVSPKPPSVVARRAAEPQQGGLLLQRPAPLPTASVLLSTRRVVRPFTRQVVLVVLRAVRATGGRAEEVSPPVALAEAAVKSASEPLVKPLPAASTSLGYPTRKRATHLVLPRRVVKETKRYDFCM